MNPNRRFLLEILGAGLELGVITPEDVLRHVTPDVLAHHLPVTLKVKLLEASLAAERMTASLVVETIGTEGLAEHAPIGALWACINECARRPIGDDDALPAQAEGGELKPNKTARSSSVRMPGRISALSPRSRATAAAARPSGRSDEDSVDDEFARPRGEPTPEDETRPGDVTGRKM
jgi:hypothetical protein